MAAVTPARTGVSPSSSPRLPSPPPIPEVQYGPKSPGLGDLSKELSLDAASKPDEGAARRIRPGTRAADMAMGPPLVPLSQLDSPFQLQEHLKALYSHLTHSPELTHTVPISKETALQLARPPQISENEAVDKNLWLYELCRFLTQKANVVSIFLMNDDPPCSAQTCPEMRASEWQYLCAVHEPPKSCCAIDYCNHTLDWAANVLTSPKHFPSRLTLGGEAGNVIQSMRQLTNIFRRVYRIFAHAWFQHRDVFWSIEATYGLYMLFKVVCDEYHLIPEDSYTIPPEAEGTHADSIAQSDPPGPDVGPHMQILRRDNSAATSSEDTQNNNPTTTTVAPDPSDPSETSATTTISTGATTRRHKHTPSTGSHVTTIAEGPEDEDDTTHNLGAPKNKSPQRDTTSPAPESSSSPPKPATKKEPSADRVLPKLNISATLPKYEPRAPEDPTPTGTGDDVDPMTITTTSSQNEPTKVETPIAQQRNEDEDDEQQVTSPSGGSIRTGGSDVLKAILGHIDDLDDDEDEAHPLEQQQPASPGEKPPSSPRDISIGVEEKVDDDHQDDSATKESLEEAKEAKPEEQE